MGSAALWQGFGLRSVQLRLARGYQASLSTVELFVRGWGGGFAVLTAGRDQDPEPLPPDAGRATTAAQGLVELEPPTWETIPWSGWLTLVEIEDGQTWLVQHGPLYVVDVEEVLRSGDADPARWSVLRLTLADPRWRWGDGVLRRWSYNRARADGALVPDSLRPADLTRAGLPWTAGEVVADVASHLRGAPVVTRTPARLGAQAGPVSLPPWSPALAALGELGRRYHLEEPCLAWNGRVELYEPGEAAGAGDPAGVLVDDQPPELRLWLEGRGSTHQAELGWPADYVLVRGGARYATAAVDGWVPVLEGADGYAPLDEATLVRATGGAPPPGAFRSWLEWLNVWLLGPRSHKGITGVSRALAELLDAQAYHLWALPGALDPTPGRRSHLLPLGPRAEAGGDGRRLPLQVLTYGYAPAHVELAGTSEQADATRAARASLAAVNRAANEVLALRSGPGAFLEGIRQGLDQEAALLVSLGETRGLFLGPAVRSLTTELVAGGGLTYEALAQELAKARSVEVLARRDPGLAGEYERALKALYEAEGGDRALIYDAAKVVADVERQLREESGPLDQGASPEALLRERPQLEALVRAKMRALEQELQARRAARELASRTGAQAGAARPRSVEIHENLARDVDAGATVYDADRGVVRTSRRACWLADPEVTDPLTTHLVPKPVRVVWGCQVRPRRDLPPGTVPAPQTGAPPADQEPDVVPTGRHDGDSWFTAVYARSALGRPEELRELRAPSPYAQAQGDPLAALRARVLSRATPVDAPDLVELVPLPPARGNELELDRGAFEAAQGPLSRRALIRSDRVTLARPIPVRLDGVVAGVTITSRPDGAGFQTEVVVGSSEAALDPYRTRVRPRGTTVGVRDAARREGASR